MTTISERMRSRREALGLSKAAVARALGTYEKQVLRWEAGQEPRASQLLPIAEALNMPVSELLGATPVNIKLSGPWFAIWQTSRDGIPTLNRHELDAKHHGEFVYFRADGDYDWIADMFLSGSQLTGRYKAVDESRQERGVMELTLDSHGYSFAIGHWAGAWADGISGSGLGVIARSDELADKLMKRLMENPDGLIKEWPKEAAI